MAGRKEFAESMIEKYGIRRKDAFAIVDDVFAEIRDRVFNDERVQIRGFGTFSKRTRKARTSKSGLTGKDVHIPECTLIHFRPGRDAKE